MGQKSKVLTVLPSKVREELNQKLITSSFTGYEALETWLREQGYEISESSIYRYSVKFQAQLENLEIAAAQAKAITEGLPDDEDQLAQALSRLAQGKLFEVLQRVDVDVIEEDLANSQKGAEKLSKLVSAISKLNSTSVNLKKYAEQVRAKARAAANDISKTLANTGISDTAVEEIRNKILGVAT